MENLRKQFDAFVLTCELMKYKVNVMNHIPCIMESNFYEDYNWFCAAFMTDKFGGIAAIIKYYDNKWFVNEEEVSSMDDALARVPELMADLYSKRDLDEIYTFVNAEYD